MSRLSYKSLFIILCFLLIPIILLLRINQKPRQVQADWYDSAWGYRKQLVFNNINQAENLQNFPVMVKLTTSNFDFSKAKTDGADIRFTDSDGQTLINYEIESYDKLNRTATLWVNVPQIDASSATDSIYIYYGNPSADDAQDSDATWNSNYKGVWHLNDHSDSTQITDSSGNDNHLSSNQKSSNFSTSGNIANGFTTMGTPQLIPNQPGSTSELYPSLKLDSHGYPVLAILDATQNDLLLVHCNDLFCTGNNETVTVVDSTGSVGYYPSLQLDSQGFPVIAYFDNTNTNLKLVHCGDANCSANNVINTLDSTGTVGLYPILQLDSQGFPVIAYYDSTNTAVKLIHCADANCTPATNSVVTVDNAESDGNNFHGTSMVLDSQGFPVMSYHDSTNTDLKLTHCGNANCSANNTTVTVVATSDTVGQYTSLQLDASGYPMIAYWNATLSDLQYVHCTDANCSSPPTPVTLNTSSGTYPWMQLSSAGNPIIAAAYSSYPRLFICSDTDCTTDYEGYISTYNSYPNYYPVMELDSDGYPVVATYNRGRIGTFDIYLYHTNPKIKQDYNSDFDFGTTSFSTSLWFKSEEASNNYLLTRYDYDQGYKIWLDFGGHPCFGIDDDSSWGPDDYACTNPSDTVTNVDSGQAGDPNGSTLMLDPQGFPVFFYFDDTPDDLEFVRCTDANCSGTKITAVIDTGGDVGRTPSMQLVGGTTPVVAYHDNTNQKLKLAVCGDANCSSGNTINTIPDSTANVGDNPALQIDSQGFPVIAYYDATNTAIKLVHCNDPYCSGDDETINFVDNTEADVPSSAVGDWMVLDSNGYPVMAYYDDTNDNLKFTYCNDPNCEGNDETTRTLDSPGNVGAYAALELDQNGYPVIAYADLTYFNLKLARCNDATCSSVTLNNVKSGENGEQGYLYIKLEINSSNNPVILHSSYARYDHVLTTCNDPYCAGSDETFNYIRDDSAEHIYHNLQFDSSGNPVILYSNGSDLNLLHPSTPTYTDTNAYDNGNWHHLVAVKDANSAIRLYIDGTEVASDTSVNRATLTSDSAPLRLAENILNINSIPYSVDNWNGQIDEVQIDSTARSPAWIAAQYLSESNNFINVQTQEGKPRRDGPIIHYKFDEGFGTTVNNSGSIGSTLNATLINSPSWSKNGKVNGALSIGSTSQSAYSVFNQNILKQGQEATSFSISAWVKPNTTPTGNERVIAGRSGCHGGLVANSNMSFGFNLASSTCWTNSKMLNSGIINNWTDWHHITGVYNNRSMKIYVDGKLKNTDNFPAESIIYNYTDAFYIGAIGSYFFDGLIDEVKIYDYALSEDEIKTDYNLGASTQMGSSTQNIGGTITSTDYCLPGDTTYCAPPVAEWNFNEKVGTSTFDTSGNNNHARFVNMEETDWQSSRHCHSGSCLEFDTGDEYLDAGTAPSLDITGNQVTIEAWANPSYRPPASGTFLNLIVKKTTHNEAGYGLTLASYSESCGRWGFRINNTGVYPASACEELGRWDHIVGVYDGSKIKLYQNGVFKGEADLSDNIQTTASSLKIGYGNGYQDFRGKIDQIRIYNYARTPAQIAYDYNKGAPIAHWKLDECQGTTVNNSIGTNLTGTIIIGAGGTQTSVGTCSTPVTAWGVGATGHSGSSLNFDGTDDYINLSTPIFSTTNSSHPYSAFAWIKTTTSDNGIITQYSGATEADRWGLRAQTQLKYWKGGSDLATSTTVINDGTWHFVGFTKDSSQNIKLYVDGKLDGTGTDTLDYQNANTVIGMFGTSNTVPFKGQIDDVKIYNYALTSEQIKILYNNGAVSFQ